MVASDIEVRRFAQYHLTVCDPVLFGVGVIVVCPLLASSLSRSISEGEIKQQKA